MSFGLRIGLLHIKHLAIFKTRGDEKEKYEYVLHGQKRKTFARPRRLGEIMLLLVAASTSVALLSRHVEYIQKICLDTIWSLCKKWNRNISVTLLRTMHKSWQCN